MHFLSLLAGTERDSLMHSHLIELLVFSVHMILTEAASGPSFISHKGPTGSFNISPNEPHRLGKRTRVRLR